MSHRDSAWATDMHSITLVLQEMSLSWCGYGQAKLIFWGQLSC